MRRSQSFDLPVGVAALIIAAIATIAVFQPSAFYLLGSNESSVTFETFANVPTSGPTVWRIVIADPAGRLKNNTVASCPYIYSTNYLFNQQGCATYNSSVITATSTLSNRLVLPLSDGSTIVVDVPYYQPSPFIAQFTEKFSDGTSAYQRSSVNGEVVPPIVSNTLDVSGDGQSTWSITFVNQSNMTITSITAALLGNGFLSTLPTNLGPCYNTNQGVCSANATGTTTDLFETVGFPGVTYATPLQPGVVATFSFSFNITAVA